RAFDCVMLDGAGLRDIEIEVDVGIRPVEFRDRARHRDAMNMIEKCKRVMGRSGSSDSEPDRARPEDCDPGSSGAPALRRALAGDAALCGGHHRKFPSLWRGAGARARAFDLL